MIARAAGAEDLRSAADQLAARLPSALAPFARLAFNYRWSWTIGGESLWTAIDADRWEMCGHNPVRLLQEAPTPALERAAGDRELVQRAYSLEETVFHERREPQRVAGVSPERPVAFLCAEYGVHASLPIYAGGLGVLAGDLVKAASDSGLPMVALGLLYRQGYFRQRFDTSGWQHEYWIDVDRQRLPGALVTHNGVDPLTVAVPIRGREVVAQIWRIDVGRVPLFLLDVDRPENDPVDRWITSRLYVGDRDTRLAQYALLGLGGPIALRALGIEPGVIHLNEGHAGAAAFELAAEQVAAGHSLDDALAAARARIVFTTHTPVAAGNESYPAEQFQRAFAGLPERLGTNWDHLLGLGRVNPSDSGEGTGMTPIGLRLSRRANGVSERHGGVARAMWRGLYAERSEQEAPIGHVTNGVHLATWMAEPMRELLARHLGADWETRCDSADTWAKLSDIPDAELWAVRHQLRAELVEFVRTRATLDRLSRGEPHEYVELAARAFDPDRITIGFARRLATYKRVHLLNVDLARSLRLLGGQRPVQILFAGKAHPQDDGAKRVLQVLFAAKGRPLVGERIAYLHDYDMEMARHLVAGCDVWVNVPRPPLEASGTSGMKAALNGGINLSVLDGWWAEAYDGSNGWALDGTIDDDHGAQDDRDAHAMLDRLEQEVVPAFHDRDADGLPRAWLERVKASLRTAGLHFTARRMLSDYAQRVYPGS
ncbi:MAG: alpha-glucan family phosphorylase [Myxococcota bacterium]|nr:alpha-glucan family phosphorylase [Myxococcota bacterium]